jgi:hypothetical protein
MPLMKFLKKNFPYNGRRMAVGQELEVESRFVPLLRRFKIAELVAQPSVQTSPPPPKQPEVAPVEATHAEIVPNPVESTVVENPSDVAVVAKADVIEGEPIEEKDLEQYQTREMTA